MTAQPAPTSTAAPGGAAEARPVAEVDLAIGGMTCASCVARVETVTGAQIVTLRGLGYMLTYVAA